MQITMIYDNQISSHIHPPTQWPLYKETVGGQDSVILTMARNCGKIMLIDTFWLISNHYEILYLHNMILLLCIETLKFA